MNRANRSYNPRLMPKWIMLLVFLIAIVYPMLVLVTPLKNSGQVHRMNVTNKTESFTSESWLSGRFQESVQSFVNDNIGLYPFFIKLHNQLDFIVFNEIHTGSVIQGKQNYLFENSYTEAIEGYDLVHQDTIEARVARLKVLQEDMAAQGKYVMVCLAASKNRYYKEYIPWVHEADVTNRSLYLKAFDENNINYFNTDAYFASLKDSLGYLMFPQYGVHWSHYSTILMADTLTQIIASETGWRLPELVIKGGKFDQKTRYYDNDIADAMNLFKVLEPDQPMYYPEYVWERPDSSGDKKSILFVGDSFSWDFYENSRMGYECFDNAAIFYYNLMYRNIGENETRKSAFQPLVRHINFNQIMEQTDVVMIVVSESNLANMGWNFMLDYSRLMADSTYHAGNRMNKNVRNKIHSNKGWLKSMERQALKRGIEIDSFVNLYLQPSFNPYKQDDGIN